MFQLYTPFKGKRQWHKPWSIVEIRYLGFSTKSFLIPVFLIKGIHCADTIKNCWYSGVIFVNPYIAIIKRERFKGSFTAGESGSKSETFVWCLLFFKKFIHFHLRFRSVWISPKIDSSDFFDISATSVVVLFHYFPREHIRSFELRSVRGGCGYTISGK